jgi:inner membrane protein
VGFESSGKSHRSAKVASRIAAPKGGRPLDNLCHTLAGAAIAQAVPLRRAPLAAATVMLGANLPDVDSLVYVFGDGVDALAFRRGWTHGILAMTVLPFVLAGAMLAFDRLVRLRLRPERPAARWEPLLLLSALGVLSHPLLDFLNTYGVRFLAPFSWEWFYGDALFIVDPWVWIALAVGVFLSRRRARRKSPNPERPARIALLLTAAYAVSMMLSGVVGRLAADWSRSAAGSERRMVGPVPLNPFRRQLVLDFGDAYRYGSVEFLPRPAIEVAREVDPKGADDPLAREAAATDRGRKFLSWSRFPIFRVDREADGGARVELQDARYPPFHGSWASTVIVLPASKSPKPGN